jgi:hypothetical protein
MMSLLLAVALSIWVIRNYVRYPAFFLVALFLTWQFALKVFATVFLDLLGPVYSDEVYTEVGGFGASAPLMVLFIAIPLGALWKAMTDFRHPLRLIKEPYLAQGGFTQADLICWLVSALLCCLYVDMIRLGQIPLLSGLERFEYQGGLFHNYTLNFLFLISLAMGYAITRTRLLTGRWDMRFGLLLLLLFFYLLLTGHRFGAFFVTVSFVMLPLAAFFIAPQVGMSVATPVMKRGLLQRVIRSRFALVAFSFSLLGIVLLAMAHSLLNVRDGDPAEALLQRLLVQPAHLYWLTWERWHTGQMQDMGDALDFVFHHPFDPSRNTGIQYLMFLHLGHDTASRVYENQQVDYAGGYPEILMEVGGVGLGLFAALIASTVTAWLYRIHVLAVCRGHPLTALMSVYVALGIIYFFLGGMLNFVAAQSYWLKIGLLLFVVLLERGSERSGRRLIPWILVPRPHAASTTPPASMPPSGKKS